jgi:transcriptional regulator with XRE-family HTH domain
MATVTNRAPSQLPATMRLSVPQREKHRKQRLYTVDRRHICEEAQRHPNKTQAEIANEFGIDRSTVSKLLKEKDRWLHAEAEPKIRMAKYRYETSISCLTRR